MKRADFTQEIIDLRPMLKCLTRRFTRDREESLDLMQDTLLKALLSQAKFRKNINLKGWLFTIMRNTFINNCRRQRRTLRSDDDTIASYSIKDSHTFAAPDTGYEYEEIWKNVHQIKEAFVVPFKMHISGYKYNEIAEHLALPIGTVKSRIFQARKEIQKRLAGY